MEKGEELGEARVKLCVSSIQKLTWSSAGHLLPAAERGFQITHPALPHPRIQHGNKKERSDNESILLLLSFEREVKKTL